METNQFEVKVTVLKEFFAQQELEDRSNRSRLGRCIATEGFCWAWLNKNLSCLEASAMLANLQ